MSADPLHPTTQSLESWFTESHKALLSRQYEVARRATEEVLRVHPGLASVLLPNLQLIEQAQFHQEALSANAEVDVVVPVFNALADVRRCLASLLRHRGSHRLRLIIVNDASDEATTDWLRQFAAAEAMVSLVEHAENQGYTRSINDGLRLGKAPYRVLLNSDTMVTAGWLQRLIACFESDPQLGLVGPLSNAASWQNVPALYDETGRFAVNNLPVGFDLERYADAVRSAARCCYPRVPVLNGFCIMIRSQVLERIGLMDEARFPVGYGEENDFCLRAQDAGYTLAVADDVFVFHAKSKSFGHERRQALSRQGRDALRQKHGVERVDQLVALMKVHVGLDEVRHNLQRHLQTITPSRAKVQSPRLLYLLPVRGGGGGVHSVVQEAAEMLRLGVHVRIAVRPEDHQDYLDQYHDVARAPQLFMAADEREVSPLATQFDIAIATIHSSVQRLQELVSANPALMPAYYVQDYEPLFFTDRGARWQQAKQSYRALPHTLLFAKTHWLVDTVRQRHDLSLHKVVPSLDHGVYHPRPRPADGKIHLTAMIRPSTPRRGAARTIAVLSRLMAAFPDRLVVHLFGCDTERPEYLRLGVDFPAIHHGVLKRLGVAEVLAQSDIFLDLSDYQAFGRTALEAMACGATAVVPMQGGANEYAHHGINALVVDTLDEAAVVDVIQSVLADSERLASLQRQALLTASRYSVHAAAMSIYLTLAASWEAGVSRHHADSANQ